jgi:hypothetical protein
MAAGANLQSPQHLDGFGLPGGMCIDHGEFFAEAQTRTDSRLELAAGLQNIDSTDNRQHPLAEPRTPSTRLARPSHHHWIIPSGNSQFHSFILR